MKKYKEIVKALPPRTVVITTGDFNPPTKEHELLIKVVKNLAVKHKADYCICVSSKKDKNNPIEYTKKKNYLNTFFPKTTFKETHSDISEIVNSLQNKYKRVIVVSPDKKVIKGAEVVSFEKNIDTKALIKHAKQGEYESFKDCLPTTSRELVGKRLMNDVRVALGLDPIKEHLNLVKNDLRESYFQGEVFNDGDFVECNEIILKVIKRGSNHLLLQDYKGKKVSKWIHEVKTTDKTFMESTMNTEKPQINEINTDAASAKREQEKAKSASEMARLTVQHAHKKEQLAGQQAREKLNLSATIKQKTNETAEPQVVDSKSKYNIAKSVMSLKDFRRMVGMPAEDESQCKETESDHDAQNSNNPNQVGSMHDRKEGEQLRRMKDEYQVENQIPTKKASEVTSSINPKHEEEWMDAKSQPANNIKKKKTFKEGAFYGRDDMVKKSKAEDKAAGMVTLRKHGPDGTHGVTVHHTEADKYRKDGYEQVKEETQEVNELDKKTLASYATKAAFDSTSKAVKAGIAIQKNDREGALKSNNQALKRASGISLAARKLAKEEFKTFEEFTKELSLEANEPLMGREIKKKHKGVDGEKHEIGVPETDESDAEVNSLGEEFTELTEHDIQVVEDELDSMTDDEIIESFYTDDECVAIDEETGEQFDIEPDAPAIMEVMSRHERIIARARLRRSAPRRMRARRVALRRISTPAQANRRARRMAISQLKKRLLSGRNPHKVSVGEKERVERFIKQRNHIVNRLATRMSVRVKKVERSRFASHPAGKFSKPNNGRKF